MFCKTCYIKNARLRVDREGELRAIMYSGKKIQASGYLANTTEPANGERGAGAARRRTVAGKERLTGFEKKSEGPARVYILVATK